MTTVDEDVALARQQIGQPVTALILGQPTTGTLIAVTNTGWLVGETATGSRFGWWLSVECRDAAAVEEKRRKQQFAQGRSEIPPGGPLGRL